MKVLALRLVHSGRGFVESALAAYDREDMPVFLLHAGTALEHLLKARLAELNPALLAKRDHVASLVWFADESKHSAPTPADLRTIMLDEAMALVTGIGVALSLHRQELVVLQRHRNGVAHFGPPEEKVAHTVLVAFLRTLILLASEMNIESTQVFGEFNEFVLSQLNEAAAEEVRVFEGRVAQANMRFRAEYGDLTPEAGARMRELIEARWSRKSISEQMVTCTVCGFPGFASGDVELTDWDVDFDREGNPEHASPVFEFRASEFQCPTCGLTLESSELVSISGLVDDWELSGPDYDEFMSDYMYQHHEDYGD